MSSKSSKTKNKKPDFKSKKMLIIYIVIVVIAILISIFLFLKFRKTLNIEDTNNQNDNTSEKQLVNSEYATLVNGDYNISFYSNDKIKNCMNQSECEVFSYTSDNVSYSIKFKNIVSNTTNNANTNFSLKDYYFDLYVNGNLINKYNSNYNSVLLGLDIYFIDEDLFLDEYYYSNKEKSYIRSNPTVINKNNRSLNLFSDYIEVTHDSGEGNAFTAWIINDELNFKELFCSSNASKGFNDILQYYNKVEYKDGKLVTISETKKTYIEYIKEEYDLAYCEKDLNKECICR